jgi:hypothetical protein
VDASGWDSFMAQCQDSAPATAATGGTCEQQCAARFSAADQAADACACTYGCHAAESEKSSEECLDTCDHSCDDEDECDCKCGDKEDKCTECTFGDKCEDPCKVGCSMLTDNTANFSGLETSIAATLDDAEETVGGGEMDGCTQSCEGRSTIGGIYDESSDLELMDDQGEQLVGIRFGPVNIPAGAKVLDATIQFVIDEVKAGLAEEAITIAIYAEAVDDSVAISKTPFDLSSRAPTNRALIWQPPKSTEAAGTDWSICWEVNHCSGTVWGNVGATVESPNLAHIVQEVVNRPGWVSGNSLMILFGAMSGTGVRTVESKDKSSPPTLQYEFDVTPEPPPPETQSCGGAGGALSHGR